MVKVYFINNIIIINISNLYIFFINFINIYYFIEKNIVLSKQLYNKSKKNTILLLIYVILSYFLNNL